MQVPRAVGGVVLGLAVCGLAVIGAQAETPTPPAPTWTPGAPAQKTAVATTAPAATAAPSILATPPLAVESPLEPLPESPAEAPAPGRWPGAVTSGAVVLALIGLGLVYWRWRRSHHDGVDSAAE